MKNIYQFQIRDKVYYEDPLSIRRGLLNATDGRAWAIIRRLNEAKEEYKRLSTPDQPLDNVTDAKKAIVGLEIANLEGELSQATAKAFFFPQLDRGTGEGITEMECLELLRDFMEFAEKKD